MTGEQARQRKTVALQPAHVILQELDNYDNRFQSIDGRLDPEQSPRLQISLMIDLHDCRHQLLGFRKQQKIWRFARSKNLDVNPHAMVKRLQQEIELSLIYLRNMVISGEHQEEDNYHAMLTALEYQAMIESKEPILTHGSMEQWQELTDFLDKLYHELRFVIDQQQLGTALDYFQVLGQIEKMSRQLDELLGNDYGSDL